MKFSLWPRNTRPPAEILDEVRMADATGWHGVWLADHYMPNTGDLTPARGDVQDGSLGELCPARRVEHFVAPGKRAGMRRRGRGGFARAPGFDHDDRLVQRHFARR